MIGTLEIMLIILVVLILFGPNKLSELSRQLGHGIKEFKNAASNIDDNKMNS